MHIPTPEELRTRRETLGMKQTELARRAGIAPSAVREILKVAEQPDVLIPLLCAAAVLGLDIEAAVLAKCSADVARGVR